MKHEFQDYIKQKNRELYDVILEDLRGGHIALFRLIDEFANQSKWISVEDRLPNVGETVLCISEEGRISTEQYCKGQTGIYCEQTDSGFATHWQPLPEKP